MANSYIEYSTAGTGTNGLGQTTFSYSGIEALNDEDIKVFGQKADGSKDVLTVSSRNTSAKTVTLSATPTAGYYTAKVRVYRSTTSNALVDFVDGARLTESDLDTAYKQGLFVAQEVAENASGDGASGVAGLTDNNLAESFYKEGTFTVTAAPNTSGTITLNSSNNTLSYTKIGNRVFVSGSLLVSSVSSPVGAIILTTLPYNAADLSDTAGNSIAVVNIQAPSSGNIGEYSAWVTETANNKIAIYGSESGAQPDSTSANKLQTNSQIYISLNYVTAS
tara:strand:+ start:9667 stop:10500 length:834 start_codon:yes stop_codon:yes gene_type:complete